jgi:hypothetical protein
VNGIGDDLLWITGCEERDDKRFLDAGPAARLLYIDAGAWCQEQVFNKRGLPDEWFIPAELVRRWGKRSAAAALVRQGLWNHIDGGGYVYVWIRYENTPQYIEEKREEFRSNHHQRKGGKHRAELYSTMPTTVQ